MVCAVSRHVARLLKQERLTAAFEVDVEGSRIKVDVVIDKDHLTLRALLIA